MTMPSGDGSVQPAISLGTCLIDSIPAPAVPRRVSRARVRLPKEEVLQLLRLLLAEAPQLGHRELLRRS
jgi:hypothetical protein